ncbi:MAG: cyclic nucleotide-binding domain-containing protein [Gemmatimonadetes bacterium]|nr:cyclic nucleotide-binding domain-containing protein [Gemmatimonadota bacterium]NNM07305.1 cyclic nucleotide-binding domain-containing protein [Gemmatimonadota bacterium]
MATPRWDLFEGLSEEDVTRILTLGSPRPVSQGTVLFRLGDEAIDLFLVQSGAINLTLPLMVNGESSNALVEERLPGQLLGWSALVPPHQYTLEAFAPVETDLLSLPRVDLLDLFAGDPGVGYVVFTNLARIVGQRLQISQTMWIREMQRVLASRAN